MNENRCKLLERIQGIVNGLSTNEKHDLMQSVVVKETAGDTYMLAAEKRRYRAHKPLGWATLSSSAHPGRPFRPASEAGQPAFPSPPPGTLTMRPLSPAGQQAINDLAQRHGFSPAAVACMLEAVLDGRGSMAQFNHPEFGGSGQWMPGGMTMLSDMFNSYLKSRVEGLCYDLANLVAGQPDLLQSGSFQSQRQGGGYGQQQGSYGSGQQQSGGGDPQRWEGTEPLGPVSLFVPPAPGASGDWWGADLRWPTSTGAQDGVRYAYFAQARRLVIEVDGHVTRYDTLDHQIGGFSQQQGAGGSLTFSSQYGLVDVARLPVLAVNGVPAASAAPSTAPPLPPDARGTSSPGGAGDIFALIERLADLHGKGILSAEEFAAKKAELLGRI